MAGEGRYTSVEICAGAGGQAIGLHNAGFTHRALIEIDPHACSTLRTNMKRLGWDEHCTLHQEDLKEFKAPELGIEPGTLALLAGGVPCPPFSLAGKQLGQDDDRDLFPAMLDMVRYLKPRAVMIENVRGLLEPAHKFAAYRSSIRSELEDAGYTICGWNVLEAKDYGVPQLRPRAVLVAMREDDARYFQAPVIEDFPLVTVADALEETMRERFSAIEGGIALFEKWLAKARERGTVAPTLVGGSKKHGGADLGPTRAKRAWEELGIDAHGVANDPEELESRSSEDRDLRGERGPKLTVQQAAIIQGFPRDWIFEGGKTARYRQVGNAFPPPVSEAVGQSIIQALRDADNRCAEAPPTAEEGLIAHSGGGRQLVLAR